MKTITAALLASAIAFPALAGDAFSTGDSFGPRQPNGQSEGYAAGPILPPKPAAAVSWVDTPWGYYGAGTSGWVDPRPGDLKEIQAANNAAARRSYDRLVAQGGCNAAVVPYAYAIDCDQFLTSHAVFGGEQNGQMGSAD